MPIAVYLPPFYSETLGLSLASVAFVFTAARVWDLVTDPIMGWVIDRYETRWGRRKHWIALSVPILVVSVWMVFLPDPNAVNQNYLLFWMIALYVGFTMMAIAHQSWGAELSRGYNDRSRLFGWRETFLIGGMVGVLAMPVLIGELGNDSLSSKVASMGWFCLVLFPLTAIPTLMLVPDSNKRPAASAPTQEAVRLILRNRILWRVLSADLLSGFGTGMAGVLYFFIVKYVFLLESQTSIALLIYFVMAFAAMPVWMKLALGIGKHQALKIALAYGGSVMMGLWFLAQPGSTIGLWSFTISYGIAFGAAPTLLRSMMADLTDEDELRFGEKRAGVFFALLTTTNKVGAAAAVGVGLLVIDKVFGFAPGDGNTQAAIDGLLLTYCLGTSLGLLLAYLPLRNYPLDMQAHERVVAQLEQKAAGVAH